MNELGKRVVSICLGLAIALVGVELAVRQLETAKSYANTSVDNLFTDYRLPATWKEPRADPARVRVLVLGDSFTWGDGVHLEDSYPFRLQFRLNYHLGIERYQVLNAGRNGLNTVRTRAIVDEMDFLASDPDLVILGFVLNDPEPTDSDARRAVERPVERRAPVGRAELELYRRSAFFRLAFDRLENSRQRRAGDAYIKRVFEPDSVHWSACVEALASLRDLIAERGAPFLVIQFPTFDAPFDDDYPHRHAHEQTTAALHELGIRSLDLLPIYHNVEVRRLAVVPFTDAHPNELAHRMAADHLADWVAQHLVVEILPDGTRQRTLRDEPAKGDR